MKDFLKKSNLPTILLSIVLAVSLWATVQLGTDKDRQQVLNNVPVRISGEATLLKETGMSIIEGKETTLRVDIQAQGSVITDLTKKQMESIYAEVDVSAIEDAGRIKVNYTLKYPNEVRINNRYPQTIELWVDRIVEREIPLRPEVNGAPAEGYHYGDVTAAADTLTLTGPETVLDSLSYARAVLNADGATGNVTDAASLILIDSEGSEVDPAANHITIVSEDVNLSMSVSKQVSVPLRVETAEAAGITADLVDIKLSADSIQVLGESAVVDKLAEEGLSLGIIDLGQQFNATGTVILPITLPNGVTAVQGEPTKVMATVTFIGVSTRELTVSEIDIDSDDDSDKWEISVLTDSVTVTVRGASSVVDGLTEEAVQAVAAVDAASLGAGVHQVPLTVTLTDAENAVITEAPETLSVLIRYVASPVTPEDDGDADEGAPS